MTHKNVEFRVPVLARVEGEGALHVVVRNGRAETVELEIYEPPRFFEAFLRGRGHQEPVDITARICGICPVAYQMSAAHAMEHLAGVHVDGQIRALRRLLYCGEWIESHVLHIGFLHAPDFLGYHSGIDIAADHPELIAQVLQLKKLGNEIMEVVGGRPIHPVNVRLGGFYRAPEVAELEQLTEKLIWARRAATDLVRWTAGFDFPDLRVDHEFVSLHHPDEYAICEGRIVSDRGLDIAISDFELHFDEQHVAHSTALHGRRRTGVGSPPEPYLTGPLARWANNHAQLHDVVRELAEEVGVRAVERNPFRSILVRGLEVLYAVVEAQRIVAAYRRPSPSFVDVPPRQGTGCGCTEAPRGILFHRYDTTADGTITHADIVPPTAQNQPAIEADLRALVDRFLAEHDGAATGDADVRELEQRCETAIRNYDPCISCATHFLTVHLTEDRVENGTDDGRDGR